MEEFSLHLGGPEGINARMKADRLVFDCEYTGRMAFTRYLPADDSVDVEASVAWFRERGWRCDCEVLFCSNSAPDERPAWRRLREGR